MKDTNLLIQYIAVGILIVGAIIWIIVKIIRLNRNKNATACCGCSLSGSCSKRKKHPVKKKCCGQNDECHSASVND